MGDNRWKEGGRNRKETPVAEKHFPREKDCIRHQRVGEKSTPESYEQVKKGTGNIKREVK